MSGSDWELESGPQPSRRAWLAVAIVIGAAAAAWMLWSSRAEPAYAASDFDSIWVASKALMRGDDPYRAVIEAGWEWPLFYPLPAVLVGVPFTLVSRITARAVFVGLSSGFLAYALAGPGWWRLLALLSPSYLHGLYHAQWTPLLVSAMLLPALGGLLCVKPSVGLAYFAAYPSRWAVIGGAGLLAASFVVLPDWVGRWLEAVQQAEHIFAPVLRPAGFLLMLGLLKWRTPQGRLLAGLGCVPHRTFLYETLPLFIVPRSFRQMGFLVLSSHLGAFLITHSVPAGMDERAALQAQWPYLLAFLYIPALVITLAHRGNGADRAPSES